MEPRWIVDVNSDGDVRVVRGSGNPPFLYRDTWIHNCLELDIKNRTAIYREQPRGASSDHPLDWPSTPFPLRRVSGKWQTYVEREDWGRWVAEQESSVQHAKKFVEKYPRTIAFDLVSEKAKALEAIRSVGFGWVDLATDVSEVLDEQLGSEDILE